jgi:hypothetical protein
MPKRTDAADPPGAGDLPTFDLPEPRPELIEPSGDETSYFDPERWEREQWRPHQTAPGDPVSHEAGRQEGRAPAVLLLSDFHLGDGSVAGDDFLDSHLRRDEELDVYVGFSPAGESRGRLFAAVLTFALDRVAGRLGEGAPLDVVLNGDVINFLELKGRGGTMVSPKHRPVFRAMAAARRRGEVFWLRGNHDYLVPEGPWRRGEFYANEGLRVLAEHGDFWDKENWPPGPDNKGSRLIIEAGAAFEGQPSVLKGGAVKYLLAGIDNLRPWNNDAIERFLDRRARYSDVAALAAVLARADYLGAADDRAPYRGALKRRRRTHPDWLMVQGHTHVPAAVPGVYYNTGSWIPTLVAKDGEEAQIESFPFLLVYAGPRGERVEEYFTVSEESPGGRARVAPHTAQSVNELRRSYGYEPLDEE